MIQLQFRIPPLFSNVVRSRMVNSSIRHGAVVFFALLLQAPCNMAYADDAPPAPSNLEDAKSDVLQLDRDIAHLRQRLLLPERTVLLFGITPKGQLSVQSLQVTLDGKALPTKDYDAKALGALLQGGMDTLLDDNLKTGQHVLDVSVTMTNGTKVNQQLEFTKVIAKDIVAIKLIEHPGYGEKPLMLVEWSQHD